MTFASPVWLLALAGLAALTLYLLQKRHRQLGVPFLRLWDGPAISRHARQRVAAPPMALALTLAAILAAIIAAARPTLRVNHRAFSPSADPIVDRPVRNVGIVLMACRGGPAPQVMLRIRNASAEKSVRVKLWSGDPSAGAAEDVTTERILDLPSPGGQRNYFVDLPGLKRCVEADLLIDDDQPGDNHAWLTRETSWPVIEAAEPAGLLGRLINVYTTLHRPDLGSSRVVVAATVDTLADRPGVACPAAEATGTVPVQVTRVASSPVTDSVHGWASLGLAACDTPEPAGSDGWKPIIEASGRTLVAVREVHGTGGLVRQAWTCIDAGSWANKPEFVAFWTGLLDWLGHADEGEMAYRSRPMQDWDPSWRPLRVAGGGESKSPRPGIYANNANQLRAFDISPTEAQPFTASNSATLTSDNHRPPSELTGGVLVAAIACLAGAAVAWRRNRPGVS